jgi:hypothetical protein
VWPRHWQFFWCQRRELATKRNYAGVLILFTAKEYALSTGSPRTVLENYSLDKLFTISSAQFIHKECLWTALPLFQPHFSLLMEINNVIKLSKAPPLQPCLQSVLLLQNSFHVQYDERGSTKVWSSAWISIDHVLPWTIFLFLTYPSRSIQLFPSCWLLPLTMFCLNTCTDGQFPMVCFCYNLRNVPKCWTKIRTSYVFYTYVLIPPFLFHRLSF